MLTPIANFFNAYHQNWQEWLFAMGVGAGCMLLALLVKVVSRSVLHSNEELACICQNDICGVGMFIAYVCALIAESVVCDALKQGWLSYAHHQTRCAAAGLCLDTSYINIHLLL